MTAPIKQAGPIAYVLTSLVVYGIVINCGAKPTLSRISSKCGSSAAASQNDGKKNASGTSTGTSKKNTKAASLTGAYDEMGEGSTESMEGLYPGYGLDEEADYPPVDEGYLGLADNAETFYNANVRTIIEGKCISCHPKVAPPALDNYANVKKASADVLKTMKATDTSVMPPSGQLPAADIAKVAEWIQLLGSEPASGGGSTSTATSKTNGSTPSTGSSKGSTATSAAATKDECKAPGNGTGTRTGSSTGKSTGTKTSAGTGTGKK